MSKIEWDYEPIPRYEAVVDGYVRGEITLESLTDGCPWNDYKGERWCVELDGDSLGRRGSLEDAKKLLERCLGSKGLRLLRPTSLPVPPRGE